MSKWINDNQAVIVCATVIAVVAMAIMKVDAKDIAVAIGGGLVGYLGGKAQ